MKKTAVFLILICVGFSTEAWSQETVIKSADGIYQFSLTPDWVEYKKPGPKIEKMFVTNDNLARFFVLRSANPPHDKIGPAQLAAYIDGLKKRYESMKILSDQVTQKYGTSVGTVSFTYEEATPKGPLAIRNYCEIMIHKKTYLNICAVAPVSLWEKKRTTLMKIFGTFKLL